MNLVEGNANVSANGMRQFLIAGTFTDVELDDTARSALGQPTFPQPMSQDMIDRLPINVSPPEDVDGEDEVLLVVESIEPPPPDEVESRIAEEYGSELGIAEGWYRVSVIGFEQVAENQFTDGYCRSGGTVLAWLHSDDSDSWGFPNLSIESFTSFTFTADNSAANLGGCIGQHRALWTPVGPFER